jgi:hypothetical protein
MLWLNGMGESLFSKVLCSFDGTHLWVSIICAFRRNKSNVAGISQVCNQRTSFVLSVQVRLSRLSSLSIFCSLQCSNKLTHFHWILYMQSSLFIIVRIKSHCSESSQSRETGKYGRGSGRARNQEWRCWRGPAAIYPKPKPITLKVNKLYKSTTN